MSNTNTPYYDIKPKMVSPTVAPVKRAALKNEFTISKNAIYDYYSTNSGIFAANPSIDGSSSGGGGGGGGDVDQKIEELENRMAIVEGALRTTNGRVDDVEDTTDKTNRSLLRAVSAVANIPETGPEYDDIDEITDATITLKHAVQTLSTWTEIVPEEEETPNP